MPESFTRGSREKVSFATILARRWLAGLVFIVLTAGITWYASSRIEPFYESETKIMVSFAPGVRKGGTLNVWQATQASELISNSLVQIIESNDFKDSVVKRARAQGLYSQNEPVPAQEKFRPDSLFALLSAREGILNSDHTTNIPVISIFARDNTPARAQKLARIALDLALEKIKGQWGEDNGIEFSVIETPTFPEFPFIPQTGRNLIFALAVSIALIIFLIYLDADLYNLKKSKKQR